MTEKRFKLDSEIGVIDTQKCGGDTMTFFEVVVELNKLNEENEKLKQNCKNYEWYKQRLYNYFADWFDDRVPSSDFSEMWDFVKGDEKRD